MSNKKTIKLWLPVAADIKHSCEIDIEGKTKEEIFNEFLDKSEPDSANLCFSCEKSFSINSDKDYFSSIQFNDFEKEIEEEIK